MQIKPTVRVRFRLHRSASSLWYCYWKPSGLSKKELEEAAVSGRDQNRRKQSVSYIDGLKNITRMGMWAFADTNTGDIHYWHNGKRNRLDLAMMLGHEVGHIIRGNRRDQRSEELACDKYGEAAMLVLRQLQ